MLASSPSPTIHSRSTHTKNTTSPFLSRSNYDGRLHRSALTNFAPVVSRSASSNDPVPTLPEPHRSTTPSAIHLRIPELKTTTVVSPILHAQQARPCMVDASTQYSPPDAPLSAAAIKTPTSKVAGLHISDTMTLSNAAVPTVLTKEIVSSPSGQPKDRHSDSSNSSISSSKHNAIEPAKREQVDSNETVAESNQRSLKRPRTTEEAKIMPIQYEKCDPHDLVVLISSMLMELIRYNDAISLRDGHLTRFHSRAPPGISVQDYLQRLTTHATLSPPILLSMVYYIDRLCALYPAFTISSLTVHRFLITSATVASKGLSDSFWTNKIYARVGGVSLKELALLELEFLARIEWRIVPCAEVLVDYYRSLVEREPLFQIEEAEVAETDKFLRPENDDG